MIRLSHRRLRDLLFFSTNVMSEAFSAKRLPGSRTGRELMISSGKGSFQRLHRPLRCLREKTATANEQDSQVEEEMMENVVMDAEGSLHQKSRESDLMDDEDSLHQKPREVCITEDTESIDLGWFDNTKLNRVKNGTQCLLQVGVTVAEVMDAEAEGEEEVHPSKRPRVAERVFVGQARILLWPRFFETP